MTLARRTDPATSHAAAAETTRRGTAAEHGRRIVDYLRTHPGANAREIAAGAGFDSNVQVSRRMKTLFDRGEVVEGQTRVDPDTRRHMITYSVRSAVRGQARLW